MDSDQILEVINKLVGEIDPVGDSHEDGKRTENLKTYLQIWDKMHTKIDDIAYRRKDRQEHSVKEMVKLCNLYLDNVASE